VINMQLSRCIGRIMRLPTFCAGMIVAFEDNLADSAPGGTSIERISWHISLLHLLGS
jgi:hypothetical protein